MNIFYLDSLPKIAAQLHCDKHVIKMIVESCQLLATAHHEHGNGQCVTYKSTHKNHPSAIWTRGSAYQYNYVLTLAIELCREYTQRYGKKHKCNQYLLGELAKPPLAIAGNLSWINPPQCMPDEYKHPDTVRAYRQYYQSKDPSWARTYYRGTRQQPSWIGVSCA